MAVIVCFVQHYPNSLFYVLHATYQENKNVLHASSNVGHLVLDSCGGMHALFPDYFFLLCMPP